MTSHRFEISPNRKKVSGYISFPLSSLDTANYCPNMYILINNKNRAAQWKK